MLTVFQKRTLTRMRSQDLSWLADVLAEMIENSSVGEVYANTIIDCYVHNQPAAEVPRDSPWRGPFKPEVM